MMLPLFRCIADSSLLTAGVVLASLFSDYVMFASRIPAVETHVDASTVPSISFGAVPDLWFGLSPPANDLAAYFDRLGAEGRAAYGAVSQWDIFPYMECYVLLLGSLLIRASRKTGLDENIAWAAPLIVVFDVVENYVLGKACEAAPDALDGAYLSVGSAANKIKWLLFVSSLLFSVGTMAAFAVRDGKTKSK